MPTDPKTSKKKEKKMIVCIRDAPDASFANDVIHTVECRTIQ